MSIKVWKVSSLGQYYDVVTEINREIASSEDGQVNTLWFRAESRVIFSLIPSLLRNNEMESAPSVLKEQYTSLHYKEDIRTQHYQAKNHHYFQKEPSSRIEWLEVMQHHGVKTRVLDWSESSTHSLLFALEPFYSSKADLHRDRYDLSPCVWVLNPRKLNHDLLNALAGQELLQKDLLSELHLESNDEDEVIKRIKDFWTSRSKYLEGNDTNHIDYIYNLSEICDELFRDRSRIREMLVKGEPFNPIFYLLARIYSDGYLLKNSELPPLAVVHPYHSERIKAQKGVFTVFPYCMFDDSDTGKLNDLKINPNSMSYNKIAQKSLHKIVLTRPQKIAGEVLLNGMNESWLYPEIPIISNEIEHRQVY